MSFPQEVIKEFKERIQRLYGKRLVRVILYGSWARNEAREDSDIDLAVVLRDKVAPGAEIDRMIDAITDINLSHNVLISVYPVSEDDYRSLKSPLLLNLRREGVPT
ncbi:MAG: nucleotidyltransferase domain-containing protein [Euryarchaeota archaeon]|nr:nucleotidyltransferase domain-containing protein [Euryarchaeota archaeon]